MVGTRQKGWTARRQLIEAYKEQGYDVAVVERTGRFIKEKDAFGLFDIIAWKAREIHFIQVTCNKPHTHKPFIAFSNNHECASMMQYVKHDGNKWTCFLYYNGIKGKILTKEKLHVS